MALNINDTYAPLATPPSASYPTGSIKDETIPSISNDGTPLTAEWGNDYVGFTDALLAAAGILNSGNPDTVNASDRLNALLAVSTGCKPVSGGGTLDINKRYLITDTSTYTLPSTTGLLNGNNVYVTRIATPLPSDPTPVVQVNGGDGESINYYKSSTGELKQTDTSVNFNIYAALLFTFNATTGDWEL